MRKFGPFDGSPFYEVENRRLQRAFNPQTGFVKTGQGAVTAGTGAQLVIAAYPDGALVDGLYVENPTSETVTLTTNTASTNPRIDRLVLRLDMNAKTIEPFQIVGTPGASPQAPPLVQTATTYDMPLCRYTMPGSASPQNPASLIDERGTLDVGTSAATANAVVRRDGAGRAQVATPAASGDIATKGYVDGKLRTVTSMASRPTTGLTAGDQLYDNATKQTYVYDGTYWRNGLAGGVIPTGASAGDYITGRAGSTVVTAGANGAATIAIGHTYSAAPTIALTTPGDDDQNLGMVTPRLGASTTTQLAVVVRNYTGNTINSGTVRVAWHVIGRND